MNEDLLALEKQIGELQQKLTLARRRLSREAVSDYVFEAPEGRQLRLSELFGGRKDLVVIHNMGADCAYCTLWADGFNGVYDHLLDRTGFVVISPDDPERQQAFKKSRDWRFPMVSCGKNQFAQDMGYFRQPEGYWPGVSAFVSVDGQIFRTGSAEIGPGDNFCAVWHIFDLLADGVNGWEPKYKYS